MTDVTFKQVDDHILREFKAEAVREGKNFGKALSEALLSWVTLKKATQSRKKAKLSDLKPVDFGRGSERGSIEADQIIYR